MIVERISGGDTIVLGGVKLNCASHHTEVVFYRDFFSDCDVARKAGQDDGGNDADDSNYYHHLNDCKCVFLLHMLCHIPCTDRLTMIQLYFCLYVSCFSNIGQERAGF